MHDDAPPIAFRYDGEAMVPMNQRFAKLCDKHYAVKEVCVLVPHQERSAATHKHYFAALHDGWLNLPEDIASDFPTEEHLRKWALIKANYCDKRETVFSSNEDARQAAAVARSADSYSIAEVSGPVLRVYTAKSQSMRAMGKKDFQESKSAVLDIIADLIGARPEMAGAA